MDVVVKKDAKKINKSFAGITQKIGENANIVDTRNVNSLREWRKNGSLVRISQEFKASNDGSLDNEKTEKRLKYTPINKFTITSQYYIFLLIIHCS